MNNGGHLTEKQLSGYFGNTLEKTKKHEIGRHLLQCDFCLKRLPQPSPEQFWAALMTENDVNDQEEEKTDIPMRSGFFTGLLTPPKMLAWGAGGLVIALIFTVLLLFNVEKPLNGEREVAEVFNVNNIDLDYRQNEDREQIVPPSVPTSEPENSSGSLEANPVAAFPKPKETPLQKRSRNLSTENDLNRNSKKVIPVKKEENFSSTRGIPSKCIEDNPIEMEIGSNNQALVFRWAKVPNAVKYHLYISDDDEILLDEYETDQETEYVLSKTLDPSKTYKWKVVITLENGELKAGNSQKFTIKDVLQNQKKSFEKKKSGKRCSENK